VGKGITFDSGGISIKPADGMYRMKDDMAGAAIVMGILKIAARINLPIKLIVLAPICENMPGGEAIKPGDVIRAYDGTSVEVQNTDAEGRLILMDALGYAVSQKPDLVVDLATLTGACTIALGRYVMGGFTNHQPSMDILKASGDYIYERVWQLPLMAEYKLLLKSLIADMNNTGGREAGVITAAVFLNHFVGKTPWIHLDIAGVTWFDSETSLIPEGASGIGVRLLVDFLRRLSSEPHEELWKQKALVLDESTLNQGEVPCGERGSRHKSLA
jgi:leucyl aminopeptidase